MGLICPTCGGSAFKIVDSVECGPNGYADETTIQRAACPDCATLFICTYSESRSFRSDRDDRVTHTAYVADRAVWEQRADVFTQPASRVASDDRIAVAQAVLTACQTDPKGEWVQGLLIRYRHDPSVQAPPESGDLAPAQKPTLWSKLWAALRP
ncbi:MAG: hypothetical protein AAFO68_02155 [Pseudomonadota bacterium]